MQACSAADDVGCELTKVSGIHISREPSTLSRPFREGGSHRARSATRCQRPGVLELEIEVSLRGAEFCQADGKLYLLLEFAGHGTLKQSPELLGPLGGRATGCDFCHSLSC